MANKEQLKILKQGVEVWNQWREQHPEEPINLRGATLKNTNLCGANFRCADIRGANFKKARLVGANFSQAKAGITYPVYFAQIVFAGILGAFAGFLSILTGRVAATSLDGMELQNISLPQLLIVIILSGGFFLLLISVVILGIRKGKALALVGVGALVGAVAGVGGLAAGTMTARRTLDLRTTLGKLGSVLSSYGVSTLNVAIGVLGVVAGVVAAAGAETMAAAVAEPVATAMAVAVAVATVVVVAKAEAFVLAGNVAEPFAFAVAGSILTIACYIGWRTRHEDPQFALLRRIGLAMASFWGTNFRNADLTDADFREARLEHTRFSQAIVIRTCWQYIKNLHFARLNSTMLADRTVRDLLVTRNGHGQSFSEKNLQGAYLVNAHLNHADLSRADLHGATLQDANLRQTNFTEATVLGVNLSGADLTGACVEAWNIDSTTQLNGAHADYVYLLGNQQERRPNSETFGEGEFSKLFQEVLHTVDFIFKNGIDWQAFLVSFDEIRNKIRVESDQADIAVQSIENKGDGVFVVKVVTSQEIDKETLHREFTEQYKHQLALQETKYQALLQGKEDIIAVYQQQAIDMMEIIKTQGQKQVINITGGVIMGDKHIGRDHIEIKDTANVNQVKTGDSFHDQAQKLIQTPLPQVDHLTTKDECAAHYQLLSEKLFELRQAYIIEHDAEVKFKLKKNIEEAEADLKTIEQRLEALEQEKK